MDSPLLLHQGLSKIHQRNYSPKGGHPIIGVFIEAFKDVFTWNLYACQHSLTGVFKDHCKPNHQCRLVMILISPMYTHQTSELKKPTVDTEPHLVQEVWSVWWWYPGSCPGLHCYNQPSSAICCPSHPTLALHNNQTWNAITRERERSRQFFQPPSSALSQLISPLRKPGQWLVIGDLCSSSLCCTIIWSIDMETCGG